jgi:hypothetical protein
MRRLIVNGVVEARPLPPVDTCPGFRDLILRAVLLFSAISTHPQIGGFDYTIITYRLNKAIRQS